MKKLTSFLLIIFLCFSYTATQAKTVKYGYIQYVQKEMGPFYSLTVNSQHIDTPVLPVKDEGCLVVPVRPVIEGLGGSISWNGQNSSVTAALDGKTAIFKMAESTCLVNGVEKPIGYKTNTIDGVTMIPLEVLFDIFDIDVNMDSAQKAVSVSNSVYPKDIDGITEMKYMNMDAFFDLRLSMDGAYKTDAFKVVAQDNLPERIALRIYGPNKTEGQQTVTINGNTVQSLRYTRFDKDIVGMALDLTGNQDFEAIKTPGSLQIKIGDRTNDNKSGETQPINQGDGSTSGNTTESGNAENVNTEEIVRKTMSYNQVEKKSSILFLDGIVLQPGTYDTWKSVDGMKYVLEVSKPAGVLKDDFLNPNDGMVNTISTYYNRLTEFTKITFQTPESCEYEIVPLTTGKIGTNIVIKGPSVKGAWVNQGKKTLLTHGNVTYHSLGDRTCILLNGIQLTEGSKILTRLYTTMSINGGKTLQISFSTKYGSVSSGTIPIYDGTVNEIILDCNRLTGKNTVTINMTEPMAHNITYRYDVKNSAITLVKPAAKEDKLVVIDAGHGGYEAGAVYNGVYEKNLNLDIALNIQRILEANGVNTYMIREDDSYVGLYERANIANTLNAALFVSIHNNALENNSNVNGSMAFYHGSSTQGKILAKTILTRLVEGLGLPNLGIREQNEYIVLLGTAMPSTLVEVAFMSGDIDFTMLTTAQFRAKAAEAIAKGIMEYMGK